MGTDAKALKKAIKDNGEQALLDFLHQINKLPKESQMGALVDLFGLEYADDVAALVGGLDSYKKSVEALKKSGKNGLPEFSGSMEKEFAERSATTASQLRLLKSALIELGITVGNMILPTVADFAAWITRLIHNLTDWTNKHPALVSNPGNYGFSLYNAGEVAISSVELLPDQNKVRIVATDELPPTATITYAFDNGIGGKSGKTEGARGNLRDSDPAMSLDGKFNLYNWAFTFELPINQE